MGSSEGRVERLASRLESVNEAVMAACEACSDDDWQTRLDQDDRPIGVVFHHIAVVYRVVTDWALQIVNDESPPELTIDQVDGLNAQHAGEAAGISREETLATLRENAAAAAASLRRLTEAQLNKRSRGLVLGIPNVKAGSLVHAGAIEHARGHLQAIQAALADGT